MADDDIELTTSSPRAQSRSPRNKIVGTPCPSDGAEQLDIVADIRRAEQARSDIVRMRELGEFEMVSLQTAHHIWPGTRIRFL